MTSQFLQHPGKLALTISLLLPLMVGCTTTQAVDKTSYSTTAAQASFSEAQLDSLLAPIALYPDTVLSHVLIASTYPLEVVEADRWARNNPGLTGEKAVNSVDTQDWDPSVKALVAFPEVLKRMSEDLDWTQQLGDAFLANEARVMDSIQKLRNRAYASGSLDKVEHVRVVREAETIVIEPSVERVVYVPVYDTRVVYGNWWWADYPPVYWHYPSSYVFVSGFYWGPRVYIGPRFYFSGCHWNQRRVVVVDHYHGHRFYDNRSVSHYAGAKHWHHNPVHRRGVAYYDNHTRERFHSPRESYGESRQYRASLRDNGGNRDHYAGNRTDNGRLAPNQARDQRQGRDEQFQQRLSRQQAGQITTPSNRPAQYQNQTPRAEQLRERMNNRNEQNLGNAQNRGDPRINAQSREQRSNSQIYSSPRIDRTSQGDRIERTTTRETQSTSNDRAQMVRPQQQYRTERPNTQRVERAESMGSQRIERQQGQMERRDYAQAERGHSQERIVRSGGGESRNSGDRGEMRGGRER